MTDHPSAEMLNSGFVPVLASAMCESPAAIASHGLELLQAVADSENDPVSRLFQNADSPACHAGWGRDGTVAMEIFEGECQARIVEGFAIMDSFRYMLHGLENPASEQGKLVMEVMRGEHPYLPIISSLGVFGPALDDVVRQESFVARSLETLKKVAMAVWNFVARQFSNIFSGIFGKMASAVATVSRVTMTGSLTMLAWASDGLGKVISLLHTPAIRSFILAADAIGKLSENAAIYRLDNGSVATAQEVANIIEAHEASVENGKAFLESLKTELEHAAASDKATLETTYEKMKTEIAQAERIREETAPKILKLKTFANRLTMLIKNLPVAALAGSAWLILTTLEKLLKLCQMLMAGFSIFMILIAFPVMFISEGILKMTQFAVNRFAPKSAVAGG